jgi:hypothetical protein
MKFDCSKCGKNCKGVPFDVVLNGKKEAYCTECYLQIKEDYKKKATCEECVFFEDESCDYECKMTPDNLAGVDYFLKREGCGKFKDASDSANLALKKGFKKKTVEEPTDLDALVKKLELNGKKITYFCCHCGWPLKVGAKSPIQTSCPRCKRDLTIIDMAKLIELHQ